MTTDGSLTATLWADWESFGRSDADSPQHLSAPFAKNKTYPEFNAVYKDRSQQITIKESEFSEAVQSAIYTGDSEVPDSVIERIKELMVITNSAITIMHRDGYGRWTP
jgi:hypothetical protein